MTSVRYNLSVWYRASRPFTLSAAVVPVVVGSALAFSDGHASLLLAALMLVASLLVQIAANLIDEYSDHARPEGKQKLIAPYKVIALGLLTDREVRRGAAFCLILAAFIGFYLIWVAGWPILLICLASVSVVYFYSAGSKPLGNLGLGHPLVFIFMGPAMVIGSYYVQSNSITMQAIWLSFSVGCTVTAILVANDLRDLEEDLTGGKITPVTLFGRLFGRWEWTALSAAAFIIIFFLVGLRIISPFALISLLAVPQAILGTRSVWRGKSRPELQPALKLSSQLHLYLGIFLSLGLVAGRFIS